MRSAKGKRVLREKDGEKLWAEFEEEPDQKSFFADQDVYESYDENSDDTTQWQDLSHGVKVFVPSLAPDSTDAMAVRWTNEARADETFENNIKLPSPCIFATDIFEIRKNKATVGAMGLKSSTREPNKSINDPSTTLVASKTNEYHKMTIRVKPDKYELNSKHYLAAKVRDKASWVTESAKYKDGEFWFHAERMSAFFIIATSKSEHFKIEQTGTTLSPKVDERIEIDIPQWTVNKTEEMNMKVWPTNESKLEKALHQNDKYTVSAMTDIIYLEHTAPKLHNPISLQLPLHGDTKIAKGDHMFVFSCNDEASDFEYERLNTENFTITDGIVRVKKLTLNRRGNGVVKTRSSRVRTHELLEISGQGYLCQFLYFKLPGGTQNSYDLWIDCARKPEIDRTIQRNVRKGMVEFPFSRSDDIPVYDQENIKIVIQGGVKVRGSRRVGGVHSPFSMKFLAMSDTTHAKMSLIKHQAIDGAYFADVDISFKVPRQRMPVRMQLDAWGRIIQFEKKAKQFQRCFSTENESLKDKSLQALANAIPPAKAKMFGRELNVDSNVLDRILKENDRNLVEFMVETLLYWKKATVSEKRMDMLINALRELELGSIAEVFEKSYNQNIMMRASDFRENV